MATIIDGKAVSSKMREELRAEAEELKARGIIAGLAVIIVGNDPASSIYVNNKARACASNFSAALSGDELSDVESARRALVEALDSLLRLNEFSIEIFL